MPSRPPTDRGSAANLAGSSLAEGSYPAGTAAEGQSAAESYRAAGRFGAHKLPRAFAPSRARLPRVATSRRQGAQTRTDRPRAPVRSYRTDSEDPVVHDAHASAGQNIP